MKIEPGRVALSILMTAAGVLHFTHAQTFASMVPDYLPAPLWLVWISGVLEVVLGVALALERTRVAAAYGLVALFIAVFPANVNMALHPERPLAGLPEELASPPALALWLRLPLQVGLILWALRYTKNERSKPVLSEA